MLRLPGELLVYSNITTHQQLLLIFRNEDFLDTVQPKTKTGSIEDEIRQLMAI